MCIKYLTAFEVTGTRVCFNGVQDESGIMHHLCVLLELISLVITSDHVLDLVT
jgi:hypothetical protein